MIARLPVPVRAAGLCIGGRAVVGASLAALALVAAGCGATTGTSNSAVTVSGSTLSIYASQPPGSSGGQVAADVLDAERLAFAQSGARAGQFHLRFVVAHRDEVSADARKAVADTTAIAYLGEISPGTSGVSVQITNELGLLQVSPTDTAIYLTHATRAVKGAPQHFYPASADFHQTFARVAPTTAAEATALVGRMKAEGVRKFDVESDGSPYGASVALQLVSAAQTASLTAMTIPPGTAPAAPAVVYAGLPGPAATHALDAAASAEPHARLFAPSALYDDTFVAGLSAAAQRALTVSAPGIATGKLDAVGRQFVHAFQSRYGHAPAPQAIFGYEAMRALVATLREAGAHAAARATVVTDFRDLKRSASQSALGAYSIDDGDISIAPFVFARVSGGRLVPRPAG